MNPKDLLEKLIKIEQAIGVETNFSVKKMLIEAEECLLQLEKERVQALRGDAYRSDSSEFQIEPGSSALRPEPPTLIRAKVKSRVLKRGWVWLSNSLHSAYQARFPSKRSRKFTQPIL